jgi:exosome complex component CSL4
MKKELLTPGEPIGLIEEYIGHDGTYEDERGVIRGKYLGAVHIDDIKREVHVKRMKEPLLIKVGDEVIGRIFNVSGVFGYVKIEVKNNKPLDRSFTGVLYPHKVVKDINNVYRVGDHIYARVVSLKNRTIHLSIAGRNYGVIKAFCKYCGSVLVKVRNNELRCSRCGNKEKRKLSIYYNRLVVV